MHYLEESMHQFLHFFYQSSLYHIAFKKFFDYIYMVFQDGESLERILVFNKQLRQFKKVCSNLQCDIDGTPCISKQLYTTFPLGHRSYKIWPRNIPHIYCILTHNLHIVFVSGKYEGYIYFIPWSYVRWSITKRIFYTYWEIYSRSIILISTLCTLQTAYCTLHTAHFTLHKENCMLYTSLYTVQT